MLRKDYSHHHGPSRPGYANSVHFWRDLNIFLILFFFFSFFAFLFLNGSAFWRDLRYALFLNSPFASADLKEGDIVTVANAAENDSLVAPGSSVMVLTIPKIGIVAPIVVPKEATKSAILASLEGGVGLYPGSTTPGKDGRGILLGHSSRATWYRGDYATVFTLISKLDPPDEFYVSFQGKKYVYQVFAHNTLSKSQTDALMLTQAQGSELDLVTCYPIGGASKRTVVQAKLLRIENI